jgi:hypothetical protein
MCVVFRQSLAPQRRAAQPGQVVTRSHVANCRRHLPGQSGVTFGHGQPDQIRPHDRVLRADAQAGALPQWSGQGL